ncbi:hypothetical protein Tco_1117458 [Tanacetum coccineum]
MKESVAYRTYYAFAFGKEIPKPKYVRRSTREKTKQAPEASPGKRLQATAKVQMKELVFHQGVPDVPTYGSEDEQISWKSSDEDVDDEVSKSKDDDDDADNEDDDGQDDDDQDDENEQTESDNDGDDFFIPSTLLMIKKKDKMKKIKKKRVQI